MSKVVLISILVMTVVLPAVAARERSAALALRKTVAWMLAATVAYVLAVLFAYPRFVF